MVCREGSYVNSLDPRSPILHEMVNFIVERFYIFMWMCTVQSSPFMAVGLMVFIFYFYSHFIAYAWCFIQQLLVLVSSLSLFVSVSFVFVSVCTSYFSSFKFFNFLFLSTSKKYINLYTKTFPKKGSWMYKIQNNQMYCSGSLTYTNIHKYRKYRHRLLLWAIPLTKEGKFS